MHKQKTKPRQESPSSTSPQKPVEKTDTTTPTETRMEKILRITTIPRVALYILGIIIVLLVATNTPFPVLNPQNAPMPYNWIVTYPPSSPNELDILNSSMIIFVVNITASQGFVDGSPITIHARAADDLDFINDVKDIWVGFFGAYWYPLLPNGFQPSPFGAVDLKSIGNDTQGEVWLIPSPTNDADPLATTPYDLLSAPNRDVVFRTAGTVPLSIVISYNNGTSPTRYTYDDLTIYIQSSMDAQQARQNTYLWTLAVVAFFFTVFDLLPKVASRKPPPSK